jgi:hypothetical protein
VAVSFQEAAATYLENLGLIGSPASPIPVNYAFLGQNPSLPALVYTAEAEHIITHDGQAGKAMRRLNITVFDTSLTLATEIADRVRIGVAGFKGKWSDVNVQVHRFTTFDPITEPLESAAGHPRIHQIPLQAEMFVDENKT